MRRHLRDEPLARLTSELDAGISESCRSGMFVHDRLANQHTMRMLCVADEHTRECLAIEVDR